MLSALCTSQSFTDNNSTIFDIRQTSELSTSHFEKLSCGMLNAQRFNNNSQLSHSITQASFFVPVSEFGVKQVYRFYIILYTTRKL